MPSTRYVSWALGATVVLGIASLALAQEDEGKLSLPVAEECQQRVLHLRRNGTGYFFSWEYEPTKDMKVTWFQARNICRRHCMDSPAIVNGWFWSGSGVRLGPTDDPDQGNWSHTGGADKPQPDNREGTEPRPSQRIDEACLAVMNNFYGDGVVWHDIACYHKKHFICEDSPRLMEYIRAENPGINLV